MSKASNSGWPDPTDWAQRLFELLEDIGTDYANTPWQIADDPEDFEGLNLKQARAAEVLLAIANALRELPLFQKSAGVAVVHDVAGAFNDVVMGRESRLFTPVRPGKPGGDGTHRNYLKVFVICAVRLLMVGHAFTGVAARKKVAEIFARAGATGRKGKSLSASTVQEWCEKAHPLAANYEYVRIDREADFQLRRFQEAPQWPGTLQQAIACIDQMANDPLLTSKYG